MLPSRTLRKKGRKRAICIASSAAINWSLLAPQQELGLMQGLRTVAMMIRIGMANPRIPQTK